MVAPVGFFLKSVGLIFQSVVSLRWSVGIVAWSDAFQLLSWRWYHYSWFGVCR